MIYMDNSATTRPFDFVADRVREYMLESFHNPSALYAPALEVGRLMQQVRLNFASDLRAAADEIFFTSGGTEANNGAILGVAGRYPQPVHFITSVIEHPSVFETFAALEQMGHAVTVVPCDGNGVIQCESLAAALRPDTVLVSIMHVNNEVGSVMDIAGLGRTIKAHDGNCLFHVDGVQAYPKVMADLGDVDLYAISGHKFHAPRGTGVLMKRGHVRLHPIFYGGGQESGLRSGTENTAGIAGLGEAQSYYVRNRESIVASLGKIRQRLATNLRAVPDTMINGSSSMCAAPHILSVCFPGIRAETLVHALEAKGIFVGTGSACSSHNKGISRVLCAMDVPEKYAQGTLRFSFGCMNTAEECDVVAQETEQAVRHLRRFVKR